MHVIQLTTSLLMTQLFWKPLVCFTILESLLKFGTCLAWNWWSLRDLEILFYCGKSQRRKNCLGFQKGGRHCLGFQLTMDNH